MGELSFESLYWQHCRNGCLSHLATLQKWLFKSCGEIPLVVLVFGGGSFLVSRLIALHVPFEFLLFSKMSGKIFFESRIMSMTLFLCFCIHQIVLV